MFFSSVAQYLLVRRAVALKTPSQYTNLSMFAVPLLVYVAMAAGTHTSLAVSGYQLFILFILAVFFSYLGNAVSLKSIEYAPNPGYSLVISKSYVVFTTIAAIFLFRAELTIVSALAILLIVASSAMISIDRKGAKRATHVRPAWFPYALLAFFCWGMLTLTSKYLLDIGVNVLSRLIYSMAIVTVIIAGELYAKRIYRTVLTRPQVWNLIGIGILGAGFNYGMQQGFATAPNVGYINAMNASSIGLVVIGAAVFFHDELTPRKLIGVAGVIGGLVLLILR